MNKEDTTQNDGSTSGSINTRRRRFLQAAGATAAMSTVAGCLPGEGSDDAAEGPLNVAHIAPLDNPLGVGSERTANMAVEEINQDGGILEDDVEVTTINTDAGDPTTAQDEVQEMLAEDGADLLVGTFVSEVTQAIMDDVADSDIPFIVTGSAAPSTVTDFIGQNYDQYNNFFRTGPINSNFQAEAFVSYADHLNDLHGWESFAVLPEDAAWTLPFQNNLPGGLRDAGYEVPYNETIGIQTEDFSPTINNIAESDADAVFRFFASLGGGQMLGEWAASGYPFGMEGIHVSGMHPSYLELSQNAAMYETTSQSGGGGVTDFTEFTIPFVESYQEEYADADSGPGGHPMYMGFNTYDALYFYKAAVEEAGTWDYVNDLDTIIDGMLSTTYTGVVGELDLFGSDAEYPHDATPARGEDDVITNFPITQWQPAEEGGSLECVYPEADSTAEHRAPGQ